MPTQSQIAAIKLHELYPAAARATAGTGLFPETFITQRVQESGYKLSALAALYNNFTGIKAFTDKDGKCVSMTTKEQYGGNTHTFYGTGKTYPNVSTALASGAHKETLFKVFATPEDGIKGWVYFLQSNPRYKKAGVFDAKTPIEQFEALKRAGYATDAGYIQKLTAVYNSLKNAFSTYAKRFSENNPLVIAAVAVVAIFIIINS